MQCPEFLRRVEEQITAARSVGDARSAAENAITATLETLNERITGGEARDLAAQLPKEIQPAFRPKASRWKSSTGASPSAKGLDVETARVDASAVMRVFREAATPGKLDDVISQLSEDFHTLLRQEDG